MTLPEDFVRYTKALMGDSLWRSYLDAMEDSPVSIRVNPFKCKDAGVMGGEKVRWCQNGYYLSERPAFTFDPLLHAGAYYVQEASSMFLDLVIRQYVKDKVVMLDLCAAPGGKSTVARTALPEGSLLVSNEPMRSRANVLVENIQKFGHPDVIVTNNYPADYRKAGIMFDVVLADVPCSGEGMFRKDEGAIGEWSVRNVEKCCMLQRDIVTEIWPCLKPGGIMVYSTCTFNAKEDEENVRYIAEELGAETLPVEIDEAWGITGSLLEGYGAPVYRFIPGAARGEGLFMAVLRKSVSSMPLRQPRKPRPSRNPKPPRNLITPELYETVQKENRLLAIPIEWKYVYDGACKALKVMHAGVGIGEIKGKDIVPSQSLALSTALDQSSFPSVELGYQQAISYLRKEPVALPDGTPRGAVLVKFEGYPLGFVKNIGSRANNLYPNEWKIKSTHVPDEYKKVIK